MTAPSAVTPPKAKKSKKKSSTSLYQSGVFHPVPLANAVKALKKEADDLEALLATIPTSGNGIVEGDLLAWFGENVYRTALLACGTLNAIPSHVARELTVGNFRADFAWIGLSDKARPVVMLIELEGALHDTLFHTKKNRKSPYFGEKFLEGFSQLVDWCAFGKSQAEFNPTIAQVIQNDPRTPSYRFALVAGSDHFLKDRSLESRMMWWQSNIKLGEDTSTVTFEEISNRASAAIDIWVLAAP